jgi:uncharacterized protein with FMN-binding domain
MRRPVLAAMSAVSVVVLGVSFQGSRQGHVAALHPAAAGLVVEQAPASAAPSLLPTTRATRPSLPAAPRAVAPTARATSARPLAHPTTQAPVTRAPVTKAPAPTSVTVNGTAVDTRYGPVQVQITVRGGHVVRADAIDYPQGGGRDQEINSRAVPQLDSEAVRADSAQIDTVSGATYTSDGYRQSLQSALDAAHQAGAR